MSLWKDGVNVFDATRPTTRTGWACRPTAYNFIGGLKAHAKAYIALTAPTVTSYKRLVVGVAQRLGLGARLHQLRLQQPHADAAHPGRGPDRGPDRRRLVQPVPRRDRGAGRRASTASSASLDPGEPTSDLNLHELTEDDRAALGIELLPANLLDATRELERDDVLRAALGHSGARGLHRLLRAASSSASGRRPTSRSRSGSSTATCSCIELTRVDERLGAARSCKCLIRGIGRRANRGTTERVQDSLVPAGGVAAVEADLESMVQERSELVGALGRLIDLRDGYLGGDAQEVMRLATAVGQRLEIPAHDEDDLALAAQVHDIGKIGVPDGILQKPGRLDDEERAIVQRHVIWGAETLERIPGLHRVARIVRAHHERWDGRGYPAGLSGEEIPTESQIIGVCEAYRAMTSDRPYRPALPAGHALGLIQAAQGTAFDPAVVASLIEVLESDGVFPESPPETNGHPAGVPAAEPVTGPGAGSRLASALQRLDGLPALVESRHRLIELLGDGQPSLARMVAVIESDVALTVAVLRLANRSRGAPARRWAGCPMP